MRLKIGTYQHYKGGRYDVVGVAKDEATHEEIVVYRALEGDRELWVRPLRVFLENVEVSGKTVPRFKYIGN